MEGTSEGNSRLPRFTLVHQALLPNHFHLQARITLADDSTREIVQEIGVALISSDYAVSVASKRARNFLGD